MTDTDQDVNLPANESAEAAETPVKTKRSKNLLAWARSHKKIAIPLSIILVLVVLMLVPQTRYGILGTFMRQKITLSVYDDEKRSPVSQANVMVAGQNAQTDEEGEVSLTVPVGFHDVRITKTYYETKQTTIEVPVAGKVSASNIPLEATGRLTSVKVTNLIDGKSLSNILVDAGNGNEANTDKTGVATLVIPAGVKSISATVSAKDFNKKSATIVVDKTNEVALVPKGVVYFLSKKTGKIDVVRTNLDGSDRKTVLAGSGFENDGNTSLLASRDWKYLALKARRTNDENPSLWLINTATNKVTEIDSGKIDLNLVGWSGHNFWYSIQRHDVEYYQSKREALKVVNADTGRLSIVDENAGFGTEYSSYIHSINTPYITEDRIVYTKTWSWPEYGNKTAEKNHEIISVNSDGSARTIVKSYQIGTIRSINTALYKPQELYFTFYDKTYKAFKYAELENDSFKETEKPTENKDYPTYIVSPSGNHVFWREVRDGKNTILMGNNNADDMTELLGASDFVPYGWFGDDYILLQKGGNELYVSTPDRLKAGTAPLKVSDYHKPYYGYGGYGYGYGGQ